MNAYFSSLPVLSGKTASEEPDSSYHAGKGAGKGRAGKEGKAGGGGEQREELGLGKRKKTQPQRMNM